MSLTPGALWELHRIHRQLADLREQLERGPKQIRASEANVKRLEEVLAAEQERLKQAKISADQRQLHLKTNEDRIEDLKRKLNACSSNREYQALMEQIAADNMANSVLSDEILETLEKIDDYEEKVALAKANLESGKLETEKLKQRINDRRQSLEMDLARLQGELDTAESALSSDFKHDYDRIVKARGEDALAQVEGGESCGGCYYTITPQMINELRMYKPVFCKSCGRFLYLPEEA